MSTIANLGFKADTSDIDRASKRLDNMGNSGTTAVAKVNKSFMGLAASVGAFLASYASISKLVSVSREFDILNAQLITATGSAENASVAFDALQRFAAKTPYDLAQATKGFTQLVNLGLTPSEQAMVSYGNTASAMGKDLDQMIEAVADATVGEFERLKTFGIKAKSEGDSVSFTFRGVTKTIKKEAASIEGYLMALGENEFAGAMTERTKTLDGAFSNLGDSWNALFLTISNQGVSSLIEKGVRGATSAIEYLEALIGSGALANGISAIGDRFVGFAKDAQFTFNFISAMIPESVNGWSGSIGEFFDNMLQGFKQLPEMTRFFIQLSAVKVGLFVDYAKIYGQAFVDIMALRFNQVVQIATLAGEKIASALNPMADSIDYAAGREAIINNTRAMETAILASASSTVSALSDLSNDLINQYALEGVASTEAYEKKISLSDQMLAKYIAEREARKGDQLAGFKVIADDADSATNAVSAYNDEYQKWLTSISDSTTIGQLQALQDELTNTWLAMDAGDLDTSTGLEYIDQLEAKIKKLQGTMSGSDMFGSITDSAKDSLSSMQNMFEQGSRDSQKLGVAIQALSAIQAINNVVAQGSGDPYTAFPRIAAMASSMAALGFSIGTLGGSFSDSSGANQDAQGLNVWGEKSESMANGIDLVASATSKLVGINTGMLNALTNMQANLAGAAGIAIRGGLFEGDTSGLGIDKIGNTLNKVFGSFVGGLLGGSSKVTDQGIAFGGGAIGDLREVAEVFGYAEIQYKKWALGSKKTKEQYEALGEAGAQFALVFDSLATSVYEGAIALGLGSDEVTEAINNFQVEATKISLKGLSAEEQQREIEAVFSSMFDGLAGEVIPFIEDFQLVGEGLGETLARVAAQVQVAEYAADKLGFTLGDKLANPELFAQIADNLTQMVGGLDEFAEKTSSFIENFAPDVVKFDIASQALNDALKGVGLTVPDTANGFWELMQGLDGTTEAGREQIAVLLNNQEVAKAYYKMLEDKENERADAVRNAYGELEKSISLEKQRAQAVLDGAREAYDAEVARINGLKDALNEQKAILDSNLADSTNMLKLAFDAEQQRLDQVIANLQAEKQAVSDAFNERRSILNASIGELTSLVKNLDNAVDSVYKKSVGVDEALAAARLGNFDLAKGLDFNNLYASSGSFGSSAEFTFSQAVTANKLAEISDLAGDQISTEERMLKSLEAQEKAQLDAIDRQIAEAEEGKERFQEQLNTLLGIDTTVLSLEEAIAKFNADKLALDDLNYDEQMSRYDEMLQNAEDVYELHLQAYNDEIERLDSILEKGEEALNVALQINTNTLSVVNAVNNLHVAIKSLASQAAQNAVNTDRGQSEATQKSIAKSLSESVFLLRQIEDNGARSVN